MKLPPKYKVCRRVGDGVFVQCQTQKFHLATSKKGGKGGKTKAYKRPRTDYGNQLIEKQKVRYSYNITEKQLANYVKKADKALGHAPGELPYSYLESRLDNILYRAGVALSRQQARQMVSHGHVQVNGKRINIPSYHVALKDTITVRPKSIGSALFHDMKTRMKASRSPEWLSVGDDGSISIKMLPVLDPALEVLDYSTVIEFYNRV